MHDRSSAMFGIIITVVLVAALAGAARLTQPGHGCRQPEGSRGYSQLSEDARRSLQTRYINCVAANK